MKPIQGHHFIKPEDLSWRPSNLMRIPNADYLERTGNENLGARLWLIIGAPEELKFLQGAKSRMNLSLIYPTDPTQLPKKLADVEWPPKS